ncbi:MAG: DUF4835 family protein [Chitinophagales bacterium]
MMKNIVFQIIFVLAFVQVTLAQEIICDVTVTAPDQSKVQTDPKVFKTLENSIAEFINTRKWTTETYKDYEKIQMSIFIGIKEQIGDNGYTGTMTVVTKRPVFNSNYNTSVLNIIDNDVSFIYKEFDPIEFNQFQFTSNLSHILAYYAYLAIAVDNETFEEKGGQKYLEIVQDMVALVGSEEAKAYKGWKSYDKNQRNRYWFITHLVNGRYEPFRKALYLYHRQGLDNFYTDPELARQNITLALEEIAKVSQDNPNLSLVQTWSETKKDEIIGAFSEAPIAEQTAFIELMKKADPVNASEYRVVKEKK